MSGQVVTSMASNSMSNQKFFGRTVSSFPSKNMIEIPSRERISMMHNIKMEGNSIKGAVAWEHHNQKTLSSSQAFTNNQT